MRSGFFRSVAALFALVVGCMAIAEGKSTIPLGASQPTIISLLQGVNNSVQLTLEINGQFSYPFVFSADPQPTSGIMLSSTGLISGTPSPSPDQNVTITVKDSNGTLIATYPVVLHVTAALSMTLAPGASTPASPSTDQTKQSAHANILVNPIYEGGDTVSGVVILEASSQGSAGSQSVSPDGGNYPSPVTVAPNNQVGAQAQNGGTSGADKPIITICKSDPKAGDECDPNSTAAVTTDTKNTFSYLFNTSLYKGDKVLVSSGSAKPVEVVVRTPPPFLGEEMRAIVGYQQAGASSSDSKQNWFLDFYISRPLAFLRKSEGNDAKWRWWGNVRVASFPQPGNQSLAEVVSSLPAQLGALKLNQLAEGAEFLSGIEFKIWKSFPFRGFSENTRQVYSLGFISGFGATGFFHSPSNNVQVFQVPASSSPQFPIFQKAFPGVTTANVGFISPDVERFPKQFLAGVRLTTHYVDPSGMPLTSAPAMLAITFGQNQVISGGKLLGVIGRFEAFYPLPFGNRGQTTAGAFSSVYLFGDAQMSLRGTQTAPTLALNPVSIPASDPSVTLVPLPNTRDEYRIGFGIDLVSFISALTGGSAKKNTAPATTPNSETSSKTPASRGKAAGTNQYL